MNIRAAGRPVEILLVEDNPGDVRLVEEALKDADVRIKLHLVKDGVEALEFLRRESTYGNAPRPDLILLDLNLPRKSGMEVLAAIKADEELKRVPVVVLTVSSASEDVAGAYDLHANCYITKPVEPDCFLAHVKHINDFWSGSAELPPNKGDGR
jgi:chemotaxis family two-component system response regulator Rcp1